jgi:hypothetical protein
MIIRGIEVYRINELSAKAQQEWDYITSDEALTEMLLEAGPNGDGYVFAKDGQYIGHLLVDEE